MRFFKKITIVISIFSGFTSLAQDSLAINKDYVVLIMDSILVPSWQIKAFKPLGLDSSDISEIDSLFKGFLSKNSNEETSTTLVRKIGKLDYRRQYIPGINLKGEKTVWINCFCVEPNKFPAYQSNNFDDWNTEIIVVNDGGNCYFSVFLNLETQGFYDLYVNGI
jgi:hypothetical protein